MSKKELIELLIKTPALIASRPCGSAYCNEYYEKENCKIFKAWDEYEREQKNEQK